MSEQGLQAAITQLCRMLGVRWYHTADSRRSNKGWPDLAMWARGFILRELKTDAGKLTAEQQRCGDELRAAGQDWDVWRPADLTSGRILRELQAIR